MEDTRRYDWLMLFLQRLSSMIVLFWSKYLIFPDWDLELVTVVGKPIQFPKIPCPTVEQVDKYFDVYVTELLDLFNRHKADYANDPKAELRIYQ